jgi:hypothetical protein
MEKETAVLSKTMKTTAGNSNTPIADVGLVNG